MSTFVPVETQCAYCDQPFQASVARSLQVRRRPEVREAALRGTLNRAACPNCGRANSVEPSLLYMDFERGQLFAVLPIRALLSSIDACARIDEIFAYNLDRAAPEMVKAWELKRRVVFGLDGLSELLRICDAELDDRILAVIKMRLATRERLSVSDTASIRFKARTPEALYFTRHAAPGPDGTAVVFEEQVSFTVYWQLVQRGEELLTGLEGALLPNCSDLTALLLPQQALSLAGAPPVGANPDVVREWVERTAG